MSTRQIPADAVTLLDTDDAPVGWEPFELVTAGRTSTPWSAVRARRGEWEIRAIRFDGDAVAPGLRLTGPALESAEDALLTVVTQGIDACVPSSDDDDAVPDHSELRLLVPFDAVADTVRLADASGRVRTLVRATVRDVPAGYPVIVALRRGADDPYVPRVDVNPVDEHGKKVRIWQTGSTVPEVELAPAGDGGHEITIRWPDRTRQVVVVPAPTD